jgi:putative oxidoreductase
MPFLADYIGWGTVALSWVVGIIFIVHGWATIQAPGPMGKLFGKGKNVGLLHGLVEVVVGVMVATGWGTFFGTSVISIIMVGAIYFKVFRWRTGFSSQSTTGWEFDLLILAAALTLLLG